MTEHQPRDNDDAPPEPEIQAGTAVGPPDADQALDTTWDEPTDEGPEQSPETRPRLWIASLLDYNNNCLHGRWIDAARDPEAVQADIRQILADSPTARALAETAEEWAIFDFDNFGSLRIDEHEDLHWVTTVARGIVEHGPAYSAWADVMQDIDGLSGFDEAYIGHYDSLQAYVDELIEETGIHQAISRWLPAWIQPYVAIHDLALARDLEASGDVYAYRSEDGGVWLFRGR